jgi:uncharacterized membrane protein
MTINKYNKIFILVLIIVTAAAVFLLLGTGCTINDMIMTAYNDSSSLTMRNIDIDDKEVESIKTVSSEMEKSYDISKEISTIADELENPFKPFYLHENTEVIKNILILENIYTEGSIEYCELKLNDYKYILTEQDTFHDIYMIQSINDTTVIVLKGDEILTLFIGEMVHD